MNVLIVSTHDQQGGAAIAAYRLLKALNKEGVTTNMLTIEKKSDNPNVVEVGNSLFNKSRFIAERGTIYVQNGFSKKNLFDISIANTGVSITNHPVFKKADVIHLHWINQGMLSVREIGKIVASGKKIVWTMHDMWSFTGICHHAKECRLFESGCGRCPYLNNPSNSDISYSTYLRKQAAYSLGKIHFVACSKWLKKLALKSKLTKAHRISAIPNPINLTQYQPKNKVELRKKMELPINKKIILFAAAKVSDKRKGIDYLIKASKIIAQQKDVNFIFLIAGENSEELVSKLSLPAISMGYVPSEQMANLYNAADLFVTPSLQENLPNTIMEAMACGTPCVGFDIGGVPEMIDHKVNGYVANYKDAKDLASGLIWGLNKDEDQLTKKARQKAVKHYAENNVVTQYIDIYNIK